MKDAIEYIIFLLFYDGRRPVRRNIGHYKPLHSGNPGNKWVRVKK